VGINLGDGGALMAFRIRDLQGRALWAGATMRDARGGTRSFAAADVEFVAGRRWRSGRTGVSYPVSWSVRVQQRRFEIEPLMDDQENDARASSGVLYWEGAVRVQEQHRPVGRGYLELTGYGEPLRLR
jgi:predicted secreted hydrolase